MIDLKLTDSGDIDMTEDISDNPKCHISFYIAKYTPQRISFTCIPDDINSKTEKHDFQISDKKVSFEDLNDIYTDLLDGKQNKDILKNVKSNRVRRYLYYKEYDKMQEQLLDGHAWETDKLKNTGKKYFR